MFSGLHKTCGQEERRDGTRQVRTGRAPAGMRLRRQGVGTFAGAGRVYEFETTGGIVLSGFSSVAGASLAVVAQGRLRDGGQTGT